MNFRSTCVHNRHYTANSLKHKKAKSYHIKICCFYWDNSWLWRLPITCRDESKTKSWYGKNCKKNHANSKDHGNSEPLYLFYPCHRCKNTCYNYSYPNSLFYSITRIFIVFNLILGKCIRLDCTWCWFNDKGELGYCKLKLNKSNNYHKYFVKYWPQCCQNDILIRNCSGE